MIGEWIVANKELIVALLGSLLVYVGTFAVNRIGDVKLKKMLRVVDNYSADIKSGNSIMDSKFIKMENTIGKMEGIAVNVQDLTYQNEKLLETLAKQDKMIKALSKQLELTNDNIRLMNNKVME